MTTYITVHGTGDGERPDDGGDPQWWRPESAFCAELLARAEAGASIEPFLWSGANDERERRAAGLRLFHRLEAAERAGERVHPVGHSHGGSVIAWALRYAAARNQRLDTMEAFTTVGAPFLSFRLKKAWWERFGPLGQALWGLLVVALATSVAGLVARYIFKAFLDLYGWPAAVGGLYFSAVCALADLAT